MYKAAFTYHKTSPSMYEIGVDVGSFLSLVSFFDTSELHTFTVNRRVSTNIVQIMSLNRSRHDGQKNEKTEF